MIIHSPRVIVSIAKGLRSRSPDSKFVGFLPGNPHIYTARAGLFDVDYLGHMNNASSLTHAEYARWEMTAANGALEAMYKTNTHFMVASSAIRFRRQVRPIFRKFEVQSVLGGIDNRHFWMYQTFRYPEPGNDRIRTQVLIKGVAVKDRQLVEPRNILADTGVDPEVIDKLMLAGSSNGGDDAKEPTATSTMEDMLMHFEELDELFRVAASCDDKALLEGEEKAKDRK